MKKYIVLGAFFYGAHLMASMQTRIEVKLPANESVIISYNRSKADFATVVFKSEKLKIEGSGYYCQKKGTQFLCVGDDDGGRFFINESQVRIDYLNLRYGSDEVFEYKGSEQFFNFSVLEENK